jgi:hypothetical protein
MKSGDVKVDEHPKFPLQEIVPSLTGGLGLSGIYVNTTREHETRQNQFSNHNVLSFRGVSVSEFRSTQ